MTERAGEGPGTPGGFPDVPSEVHGTPGQLPGAPGDVPAPRTSPRPRNARGPGWLAVVAVVATAVYAWFASATTPFTVPADVMTAVPLLGMVVVVALQHIGGAGHVWRRLPADRPPDGGTAVPWIVLLVLLAVPEGASLLVAGPRSSHPTISSIADTVFRWHAVKASVYFLWLWLCWYVVRR